MRLKKAVLDVMSHAELLRVVDDFGLLPVDRRTRQDTIFSISRSRAATAEKLLNYLCEADVKRVCELRAISPKGRRKELISVLLTHANGKRRRKVPRRAGSKSVPVEPDFPSQEKPFAPSRAVDSYASEVAQAYEDKYKKFSDVCEKLSDLVENTPAAGDINDLRQRVEGAYELNVAAGSLPEYSEIFDSYELFLAQIKKDGKGHFISKLEHVPSSLRAEFEMTETEFEEFLFRTREEARDAFDELREFDEGPQELLSALESWLEDLDEEIEEGLSCRHAKKLWENLRDDVQGDVESLVMLSRSLLQLAELAFDDCDIGMLEELYFGDLAAELLKGSA